MYEKTCFNHGRRSRSYGFQGLEQEGEKTIFRTGKVLNPLHRVSIVREEPRLIQDLQEASLTKGPSKLVERLDSVFGIKSATKIHYPYSPAQVDCMHLTWRTVAGDFTLEKYHIPDPRRFTITVQHFCCFLFPGSIVSRLKTLDRNSFLIKAKDAS